MQGGALGHVVVLAQEGGRPLTWADGRLGGATRHRSAVLRARDDEARARTFAALVATLTQAREMAGDDLLVTSKARAG